LNHEGLAEAERLWHDAGMPKPKPQSKKLTGKNPTDPMVLARSVVEAAIREPLINPAETKSVSKPQPKKPNKRR